MKRTLLSLALLPVAGGIVGCTSDDVNSSPLSAANTTARTEAASRKIEGSAMTPDQKAAAIAYMKNGAEGARKAEAAARQAQTPGGRSR